MQNCLIREKVRLLKHIIKTNGTKKISAHQLIPENLLFYRGEEGIIEVEIDPIDQCNQNCYWCFTASKRSTRRLNEIYLKRYLDSLPSPIFPINIIISGGGEPLLYKPLHSNSKYFEDKSILEYYSGKFNFGLITNGTLIHKLFLNELWKQFSFIRISLDAHNPTDYSKTHKVKRLEFTNVCENISELTKLKGDVHIPAIGVSFIVDPVNKVNHTLVSIKEIAVLCKHLQVDFAQIKHVHTDNTELAQEQMHKIHQFCMNGDWGGCEFWVQHYKKPIPYSHCYITQRIQAIGGKGEKYPCCHLYGQTKYLDQNNPISEPKIIHNCQSSVCRYRSVNEIYRELGTEKNWESLIGNIKNHGFHPYRLNPTAPKLFYPVTNKKTNDESINY